MDLVLRPETLSVSRLGPDQPWPSPPGDRSLFATTTSDDERSLVCRSDLVPVGATVEPEWRALTVAGPLDLTLVGVMAGLTAPLARAGVSVFVLSTFDTDHILVRGHDVQRAVDALEAAGHAVTG